MKVQRAFFPAYTIVNNSDYDYVHLLTIHLNPDLNISYVINESFRLSNNKGCNEYTYTAKVFNGKIVEGCCNSLLPDDKPTVFYTYNVEDMSVHIFIRLFKEDGNISIIESFSNTLSIGDYDMSSMCKYSVEYCMAPMVVAPRGLIPFKSKIQRYIDCCISSLKDPDTEIKIFNIFYNNDFTPSYILKEGEFDSPVSLTKEGIIINENGYYSISLRVQYANDNETELHTAINEDENVFLSSPSISTKSRYTVGCVNKYLNRGDTISISSSQECIFAALNIELRK